MISSLLRIDLIFLYNLVESSIMPCRQTCLGFYELNLSVLCLQLKDLKNYGSREGQFRSIPQPATRIPQPATRIPQPASRIPHPAKLTFI